MTTQALLEHVQKLTYRRAWVLHIWDHPFEGQYFTVVAVVADAYQDKGLVITVNVPVPPIPDADYFDRWLQWRLALIETHEAREYLRRDGKPIFDPHADGANDPPNKEELRDKVRAEMEER